MMLENLSSLALGFLVLFLILLFKENFLRNRKNLAPGPLRLPFLGNLLQIAWLNPKEPYLAFSKLGEIYGNIASVQLGSVYAVLINSFDVMEEYLHKSEFSDRYFNEWLGKKSWGERRGLVFCNYPTPWQQLRRFSLRSLKEYGFGKRNIMQEIIHAEITDTVHELKSSLKETNGIHTFDKYFNISVLNVVWSMLAGRRYAHDDPKLRKLVNLAEELFQSCNLGNSVLLAFPEMRNWFPNLTGMSTQRRCYAETNTFMQEFITERKQLGTYKTSPENLVDEFLRMAETYPETKNVNEENPFTEQQLIAMMTDMFIAGSETTSNTLAWCVLYLLLNPEVQKKLQKEIDSQLPNGTLPDSEIEPKLHYVRATLAETHRIASVLPLMAPRAPTENTSIGQYFIPKGTYVIANTHGVHHDKSYWKDPENFRPERFLDINGEFKSDPRLKPFGFGKRACLGEPVASMSPVHYLTALMQNFTFYSVPNETLPSLKPVVGVAIGPQVFRALVKCRST